jgi:hypothetical protein
MKAQNRVAANNGFTLGVRAPGQTWTQCMSSTSGTYGINGVLPSSWQNGATSQYCLEIPAKGQQDWLDGREARVLLKGVLVKR